HPKPMALAAHNRARTSVRVRGPQTTCRETTCHAPEEVEALKGSMKVAPRGPVPVRGKDQPLQTLAPERSPGTHRPRSAGYRRYCKICRSVGTPSYFCHALCHP